MALRDTQTKWNRRYLEGAADMARPEPHPLAASWSHLWREGALLDAACGRGRGIASALASGDSGAWAGLARFDPVYAVDSSRVAIEQARRIWADYPGIHWIVGDVTAMSWPRRIFGLICAFGFTDMPFFRRVPELLRPGGMFLYQGFAPRQREIKPDLNPEWVGDPEELRAVFSHHRILELSVSSEPPYRTSLATIVV